MSRVVWRPLSMAIIFLSVSVQHKQAANVGGSGQNIVKVETTTEEVTTTRGLLVNNGPLNFTVQSGTKVTLYCRVELHEENSTVSWLKRGDDSLQLLSVNTDVFKEDPRYKVNFIKPVDWQLFINPVNFSDQGHYECQISSYPPVVYSIYLHVLDSGVTMNENSMEMQNDMYVTNPPELSTTTMSNIIDNCDNETKHSSSEDTLEKEPWHSPGQHEEETSEIPEREEHKEQIEETMRSEESGNAEEEKSDIDNRPYGIPVTVPELEIADERNLPIKNKFYNSGSTIELRCLIVKVPQPTQFIIWKHNSSILNYDTTRGGISVKTDILPDGAKSQLFIANVGPSDSGNYSCSLGEEAVTWVSVVVITGETPAAMQHGSATTSVNVGLLTLLSTALAALS